jgi:hypothetical protein
LLLVRGCGRVKAETAGFVALACEMIVNGYWTPP